MATAEIARTANENPLTTHIGVLRLAATGGAAAVVIFVLCWLGTFISYFGPTHAYIRLFSDAPRISPSKR